MIKRLIFLILFIPNLVFGQANTIGLVGVADINTCGLVAIGGIDTYGLVQVTVATCDDCSGSLKFSWYMEDDDSTPDVTLPDAAPCGCSDGDEIGAETGSPTFSSSVGQAGSGTLALYINAYDEYYSFDVSSNDLITLDDVKITFNLYIVAFPSGAGDDIEFIGAEYVGWQNSISLRIVENGGGGVRAYYYGSGTGDQIDTSATTGSWLSCEYQAKTGVSGNDHYLSCGTPTEEDDDLTAKAASADTIWFGDISGGGTPGPYYLDNVKIYPSDY